MRFATSRRGARRRQDGLQWLRDHDKRAHLADEWLAQVICCLCDDSGDLFAVLQPMEVVEQIGDGSFRCRCGGPRVVSEAVALEQTAAWYWVGEEVVVVRR